MADAPVYPYALGEDVEDNPCDTALVSQAKKSIRTSRALIRTSRELKAKTESILKASQRIVSSIVWIFPRRELCLVCGLTNFSVPEEQLKLLQRGLASPNPGAGDARCK